MQRYIVALIYFQMNGANWVNCAAAVDSPCQVDTQVLQGDHFLSASHECSWTFLICDSNERITNVEIGKLFNMCFLWYYNSVAQLYYTHLNNDFIRC